MARVKEEHKQQPQQRQQVVVKKSSCCCWQVNSLPSMWYGIVVVALQVYIVLQAASKFLQVMDSKVGNHISVWETNLYLALQAGAVLVLPPLLLGSFFKLGNLANDGFRLGRRLDLQLDVDVPRPRSARSSSRDPLVSSGSACGAAWRHCPPLAASLHAISALCTLVAKVVLEARLTKEGVLPRQDLWATDLDFVFLPSTLFSWPADASALADATPFPCPEFLSYSLALLVFALRSADVYWGANKCLAMLISLQLIANGVHALLAFCGASILYKVELIGVPATISAAGQGGSLSDYLLLDPPITVMLLMLLSLTLLLACSPLTMYALNKLSSFLMRTRSKYMQELPAARSYLWSFYPHLAALATLLAVAACAAPILHDLSRLYKLNPQPILLAAVTGSIVHAFTWVALWLLLTAKSRWDFRLKISVGRTLLKSPSCLALAAQVEYRGATRNSGGKDRDCEEGEKLLADYAPPILVLSAGKAFSVHDSTTQKRIQDAIGQQKEQDCKEDHHQVYWLRGGANLPSPAATEGSLPSPCLPEPPISSSSSSSSSSGGGGGAMQGVTSPSPSIPASSITLSPMVSRPARKPLMRIPSCGEDDGDYATLRDLPLVTLPEEPADSHHDHHETSSSSDSSGVDSGFGSGSKTARSASVASCVTPVNCPRITRDLCNPYGYVKPKLTTFSPHHNHGNTIAMLPMPQRMAHAPQPFHSLPMGNRPLSSHAMNAANTHSVLIHRPLDERRPVIQAHLFAGQGLDSSMRN